MFELSGKMSHLIKTFFFPLSLLLKKQNNKKTRHRTEALEALEPEKKE